MRPDYTTVSGIERMRALLPAEEVERLQKTPFAVVQVRLLLLHCSCKLIKHALDAI